MQLGISIIRSGKKINYRKVIR